jgi:hypothetical protein
MPSYSNNKHRTWIKVSIKQEFLYVLVCLSTSLSMRLTFLHYCLLCILMLFHTPLKKFRHVESEDRSLDVLGSNSFLNTPFSYMMVMVLLSSISSVLRPTTACLSDHKRSVEYESFGSTLCKKKLGEIPSILIFPLFRLGFNTVCCSSCSAVCLSPLGGKTLISL